MRAMTLLFATLAFACSKSDSPKPTPDKPAAGSSAMAGSAAGSAMASGSAGSAGSATTMAGGSDTGSAGSGSAAAMIAGSGSGSAGAAMAGSGSGSDSFVWDKLDHKAKHDFMKAHVIDDMRTAFQTYDAKKYKDFDCRTCHGKHAKDVDFKMPTPDIPKLDFAAIQAGKQNPKMAEFMEKTVKPQMAKILHQTEYDPVTKTGDFGCLACHQQKK